MRSIKLLILAQVPPPFLGQAIMNMEFVNCLPTNLSFIHLRMNMSNNSDEFGRLNSRKIWNLIGFHVKLLLSLTFVKVEYVYFQPSGPVNKKTIFKDLPTVLLLKLFRKKMIYHFHADRFSRLLEKKANFLSFIFRKLYYGPYAVILILPHQQDDLLWLCPKKFYTLPNGLKDECGINYIEPIRNDQINLLYVGLLVPYKGIKDIILIASRLKDLGINFKVDLIGGWSSINFEREIKTMVDTMSLTELVIFHGPKVEAAKWDFFSNADLLIHPSYEDLMPLCFIEAMMFGLPVITTDLEHFKYILEDNENAFFIKKGDISMFVDKLIYINENIEVLNRMSLSARKLFIERFSIDVFRDNLCNIIEDL
jgi:glycosyltransferase involved in cell wall biosynthesis